MVPGSEGVPRPVWGTFPPRAPRGECRDRFVPHQAFLAAEAQPPSGEPDHEDQEPGHPTVAKPAARARQGPRAGRTRLPECHRQIWGGRVVLARARESMVASAEAIFCVQLDARLITRVSRSCTEASVKSTTGLISVAMAIEPSSDSRIGTAAMFPPAVAAAIRVGAYTDGEDGWSSIVDWPLLG
jgi:hypothetical protein